MNNEKCIFCDSVNLETPKIYGNEYSEYKQCLDCKYIFLYKECNICKKPFNSKLDEFEIVEQSSDFNVNFGYYSAHDGAKAKYKFCQYCAAKVVKVLLENFHELKIYDIDGEIKKESF